MVGEKIKNLRLEKNISQVELASSLYVTRQTISRWERGQTIPNTENIAQLANYFEIETNYFFDTYSYIEAEPVEKANKLSQIKSFFNTYKLDIYIFSLLIAPFFYVLLAPLSYISLYYSLKHKKRYRLLVIILVASLTVYFGLQMIYIIRHLFGSGTSTTEIFIE